MCPSSSLPSPDRTSVAFQSPLVADWFTIIAKSFVVTSKISRMLILTDQWICLINSVNGYADCGSFKMRLHSMIETRRLIHGEMSTRSLSGKRCKKWHLDWMRDDMPTHSLATKNKTLGSRWFFIWWRGQQGCWLMRRNEPANFHLLNSWIILNHKIN